MGVGGGGGETGVIVSHGPVYIGPWLQYCIVTIRLGWGVGGSGETGVVVMDLYI